MTQLCAVGFHRSLQMSVSIHYFNFQLMHATIKKVELLKRFKIRKTAPACFGLQGNHHQGATVSTWLKLHAWLKVDT